jgi:uncharacterized protein YhfF
MPPVNSGQAGIPKTSYLLMDNASARNMWGDYLDTHLQYAFVHEPRVKHLGDTEDEANARLKLVLSGDKRAISHSLLGLQLRKEPLPKIGDFTIITDWNCKARCIVRTVAVRLTPFFSIRSSYAKLDSNGSLDAWKEAQWTYISRELQPYSRVPNPSMIIVCEVFEKVFDR